MIKVLGRRIQLRPGAPLNLTSCLLYYTSRMPCGTCDVDPECPLTARSLRGQPLDHRTLRVLSVRITRGNQSGELEAQIAQLADAGVDEAQLGGGKVTRDAT